MKFKWSGISPTVALLLLLLTIVFAVPFLPESFYSLAYQLLFTAIILVSVYVFEKNRKRNLIIALAVIAIKWVILIYQGEWRILSNIPQLIFFIYVVGGLLLQIARATNRKGSVFIDCINGYFLSALVCAILIALTVHFSPGSFNFANQEGIPTQEMNEYIYHTLIVFSTTGFGDIIPKTPVAKSISTFISVAGQLYVAIIVALLIGHHSLKFRS